MVVDTTKL